MLNIGWFDTFKLDHTSFTGTLNPDYEQVIEIDLINGISGQKDNVNLQDSLINIENIKYEGSTNVEMTGDAGNNVIKSDEGNDKLYGGDGNDVLVSGAGNDSIFGEAGNSLQTEMVRIGSCKNEINLRRHQRKDSSFYKW